LIFKTEDQIFDIKGILTFEQRKDHGKDYRY
jgi:hypothetical protein